MKLKPQVLINTMLIIHLAYGLRQQEEHHLVQLYSSQRVMRSQICMRIWQQMVRIYKNNKCRHMFMLKALPDKPLLLVIIYIIFNNFTADCIYLILVFSFS